MGTQEDARIDPYQRQSVQNKAHGHKKGQQQLIFRNSHA